jgi:histidine ammonia-lyase
MKRNVFLITPEKLTFELIENILSKHLWLELSDESCTRIEKSKAWLDKKIAESDSPIYGINTGFGALCDIEISKDDLSKLQENLVLSHACNLGPEVPADVVP